MRSTLGLESTGFGVDARLAEISFGEWEGLTYADVLARDKDVAIKRESDKWGFRPPGGESYAQVTARISQWYATLERDTVVAAHGPSIAGVRVSVQRPGSHGGCCYRASNCSRPSSDSQ